MLAALVVDGLDQTIFQTFTSLPLDDYQSYDKALDVYYLSLAYLSMMRNWVSRDGFDVGRFLYYYRLVGVVLFEQTQIRALLLVFPNTFEYFFDSYEGIRTRWDPRRLGRKLLIGIAAFIWIFIKLPQEWWIHVAELDATDLIKTNVFGVDSIARRGPTAIARQAVGPRRRGRRGRRARPRGALGDPPSSAAGRSPVHARRGRPSADGRG